MSLIKLARLLSRQLAELTPQLAAGCVYDPTCYAREPHEQYLRRYANGTKRVLLLGMNPGPWGMAQTGVPFGAVPWVRKWLKIDGKIGKPKAEHSKRPVLGMKCPRVEVSGDRLWGLLKHRYLTTDGFAADATVLNYCPLLLLDVADGGCRNLPLNLLPRADSLMRLCDDALAETLRIVAPEIAVGIGGWAHQRLVRVAPPKIMVGKMLHPSPASPMANRGFARIGLDQLVKLGV